MSDLRRLLRQAVITQSRESTVALLLSAGIDSVSTGIVCEEVGKKVQAYTYELKGYRSREREKVEAIARHFGWPLRVITVPTAGIREDFLRLAIEYLCDRKVQFEVLLPLLYVLPEINELEIWTGFNADDHYGNTRQILLDQARLTRDGVSQVERKRHFDDYRHRLFEKFEEPGSPDTWWSTSRLAASLGKRVFDPYLDLQVREDFSRFDHDQLSPLGKPVVREAFADRIGGLPINKGVRLQIGGMVDDLFRTLLQDPTINRFYPVYSTVSPLCQRWGREVAADRGRFSVELAGLLPQRRAGVRESCPPVYCPYVMEDVRNASSLRRFTVISTFAGGGGSSVGYRYAGGVVLAASEFVAEAARTYRKNSPSTPVDERDIREITASDEDIDAFLAGGGLKRGDLDVLDGSPPCSEFSLAGTGIKDQDVLRSYSDVQQNNIATLPFDFIDLAVAARPKVVIMENVPAIAAPRTLEVLERIVRALRNPLGEDGPRHYYVNWKVLAASDYGVPQKRQRLFIIGVRKDVGDLVGIDRDESVLDVFPAPTLIGCTVRAALADLNQNRRDIEPWEKSIMTSPLARLIRLLPKAPPKLTRLGNVDPTITSNYTLTRCSWDLPAPTMVVSGQRPDGMTGVIHPQHDRKFTLPELKRLTSLPDDFILTGTIAQAAERICRMVPPLLTKAIADSVYTNVLAPFKEKIR